MDPIPHPLTIVLPIFNEAEGIPRLLRELEEVLAAPINIIVVDDGSSDDTYEVAKRVSAGATTRIRAIKLARNFGHQKAIMAGLSHVDLDSTEIIVVMDADFQDAPSDVPRLLDKVRQGHDCAYAVRLPDSGSWAINVLTRLFYAIQERVVTFRIPRHAGAFSAFSPKVCREILSFSEVEPYFPGLRAYVGHKQIGVPVARCPRRYGQSRVGLWGLINLSLNGLMGFSPALMRAVLYFGLVVTTLCFFFGALIVALRLSGVIDVLGFTTLAVFILGLFGIQITLTGFIGEYLGKLFIESKRRPAWIVQEVWDG